MARELGVFKRPDSRFYWINVTLPNGERLRQSTGTESREEAEAYLAKHTLDAYRAAHFGIKPPRSWTDAVARYLTVKQHLRSFKDTERICRSLDRYLFKLTLQQIDGDVIWTVIEGESKKGNKQPLSIAISRSCAACYGWHAMNGSGLIRFLRYVCCQVK